MDFHGNYILDDGGNPVVEPNLLKWAKWFEENDRSLAVHHVGEVMISTVFLGIDHNFYGKGPPLLYETMIFNGKHDQAQWRYATKEDALDGHHQAMMLARTEFN